MFCFVVSYPLPSFQCPLNRDLPTDRQGRGGSRGKVEESPSLCQIEHYYGRQQMQQQQQQQEQQQYVEQEQEHGQEQQPAVNEVI
ncbi:hypothetical protein TCAL_12475 [Tigriopus californicus]|uniref:Uncharacterized protein n=1 Tax=Tigriopus californicus TaxID=6832 RepID=A0A553PI53_TIGCA|nr:hypothetical protein TCAL_12475 [Tigriopus californicus]|eukprot:TCALIF_12475-PA protein Name:"Protein of unknown function" AED:0.51 eAED:0.51 QI:24/0/0.5/0.5/0/0/2/0/84